MSSMSSDLTSAARAHFNDLDRLPASFNQAMISLLISSNRDSIFNK